MELQRKQLKKRSKNEMRRGVHTFMQWREHHLNESQYDKKIFECNLEDLESVNIDNFVRSMSHFQLRMPGGRGGGKRAMAPLSLLKLVIKKMAAIVSPLYFMFLVPPSDHPESDAAFIPEVKKVRVIIQARPYISWLYPYRIFES